MKISKKLHEKLIEARGQGMKVADIAKRYGVGESTVSDHSKHLHFRPVVKRRKGIVLIMKGKYRGRYGEIIGQTRQEFPYSYLKLRIGQNVDWIMSGWCKCVD